MLDRARRIVAQAIISLAVSPDGTKLAAVTYSGSLLIVDSLDLDVVSQIDIGAADAEFLADGTLVCACRNRIVILRLVDPNLEIIQDIGVEGMPTALVPDGDGALFILTTECAYRFDGSLECVLRRWLMGLAAENRNKVWWLGGVGKITGVAAGNVNEALFEVDIPFERPSGQILPDRVTRLIILYQNRKMLVVRENRVESVMEVYGLGNHRVERQVYYGPRKFRDFVVAEDWNYVISSGTDLIVWDLDSFSPVLEIRQPDRLWRPQPIFFGCCGLRTGPGWGELVVGTMEGAVQIYTIHEQRGERLRGD